MIKKAYEDGYAAALSKIASGGAIPIPQWMLRLTKQEPVKKIRSKPVKKALNHGEWTIDYSSGNPVMYKTKETEL